MPKTVLKPKHFNHSTTKMANGGLAYDNRISLSHWFEHAPSAFEHRAGRLVELAAKREPCNVALNPASMPVFELRSTCHRSQSSFLPREAIDVDHGLPDEYESKWNSEPDQDFWKEGQRLVLVAFDGAGQFAGYAGLQADLSGMAKEWETKFSLHMVYVLPERRGQGFGLDLAVATAILCRDILRASYAAIPAGSTLEPMVTAEYASEAGEAFTYHVGEELELEAEILQQEVRRPSIVLHPPDIGLEV